MTDEAEPGRSRRRRIGPRSVGALAGLAPTTVILGWYVGTGGRIQPGLLTILAVAVVAGWLVGPRASGPFGSDLVAMFGFLVVGYMLDIAIDSVIAVSGEILARVASDPVSVLQSVGGRWLVRFAYLPVWAVYLSPVALVWLLTVRVIRGRVSRRGGEGDGSDHSTPRGDDEHMRLRRMGLAVAAIILGYGLFVALVPLTRQDPDTRPPWWVLRPIALVGLLAVPAVVAAIGSVHAVRPLLVAAGLMCLLQSYVAFSGITFAFMVPAIVLLWLAGTESNWANVTEPTRSSLIAGVAIIVLTGAAWVSLLALQEPRCWIGVRAANGATSMVEVPATNDAMVGPTLVPSGGAGCSSAEITLQGIGVSATFAIGAISLAARAGSVGRKGASA